MKINRECLWCGNNIYETMKIHFILSFKAYHPDYLCADCLNKFALPIIKAACPQCGRIQKQTKCCDDCNKWLKSGHRIIFNTSLYAYNGIIKEYIHKYKFQGDYRLRIIVADKIIDLLHEGEIVVPIPISAGTMKIRKFNQVTGWLANIKYVDALLAKEKKKAQFQKSRKERMQLEQPFIFKDKFRDLIKNKQVCIIDDVYTTGATVNKAAEILMKNGAKSVRSITLAH